MGAGGCTTEWRKEGKVVTPRQAVAWRGGIMRWVGASATAGERAGGSPLGKRGERAENNVEGISDVVGQLGLVALAAGEEAATKNVGQLTAGTSCGWPIGEQKAEFALYGGECGCGEDCGVGCWWLAASKVREEHAGRCV